MVITNLECVNLRVDWVSLNFNYLTNTQGIILFFSTRGFDVTVRMNKEPINERQDKIMRLN